MADRLDQLAADLEALKIEFEKYFIGVEKRMPARQRGEVSRAIRRYTPGNDAVEKFRHQGLVQRLGTYNRYWNRILRAIEEGTYERDLKKADFRAKKRDEARAPVAQRDEAKAKRKAAEVGDEAAAFLAQLTGAAPSVGLRGQAVDEAGPVVGMRGQAVAERPSVNTREIVRETLTPGKGIERPARPSGGRPPVGLRGQPVGDGAPTARPSGGHPPVGLRGAPMGGRVSAPPSRISTPAPPKPPSAPPPTQASAKPKGLSGLGGLKGLKGLGARSGGLVGGLSASPKPAAPKAGPSSVPQPPPPPAPKPAAPKPAAPRPRASTPSAPRPAPRGRPVPRSRVASAPKPASRASIPPMRGAPKAPPSPPTRGAPKAPPSPPMRGAPKAPPSPPMRGRPIDED